VLTVPLTDPAVRSFRRMAAMFGLMAVFFVVFFAVRRESPDRWTLAFYGGFAVVFLIDSYRRQRR
jgi:hypothetical protein